MMAFAAVAASVLVATVHAQQPLDLGSASITFSSFLGTQNNPASLSDNDLASQWHSSDGVPAWIEIDLGSDGAAFVSQYSITARANNYCRSDSPTSAALEGSSDGTSWTELQADAAVTWATACENEPKSFSVPAGNVASHRYYRLYFSTTGLRGTGQSFVVLSEISLIGYRPATCSTISCADGWVADASAAAALCTGETCDASGTDNELCCDSRQACSQLSCSPGWSEDVDATNDLCTGSSCDAN
eukprot:COSAG02_NODE_2041_length_10027_cov_21.142023_1_plen_244_part_10